MAGLEILGFGGEDAAPLRLPRDKRKFVAPENSIGKMPMRQDKRPRTFRVRGLEKDYLSLALS
jgi:hypothetical protein